MKEIVDILQENSRVTPQEIATRLGMEQGEVEKVLKQLEDDRVILKYTTLVNREKIGEESICALIEVRVAPQRDIGFDAVAERIYRFPEVRSVYLMSGGFDLSVFVEGKTLKDVATFVAEKLSTLEHVQSTTTHFVLKTYKQDGVIFDDKEDDHRLVVTP